MQFSKKIYDSVHGFIRFNELEEYLINSPGFQRLHYIHQLGIAYLVYPGATHTRFEHSLGVMELATRIFDQILLKLDSQKMPSNPSYWRQVIRLAALCHDLGHLPFSHVAEKELLGKEGHEKWTLEIMKSSSMRPLWEKLESHYGIKNAIDDVIKMAIGEKKLADFANGKNKYAFSPWEKVFSQIISGDFFGADRIDYLLRDAQATGVTYGLFDYAQLIEMLCILPFKEHMELGIEENGIEACEGLLLARHFMRKRVYHYSSVKAYSFHLSRFMKKVYTLNYKHDIESYLSVTDSEMISELRKAAKDPSHPGYKDALCLTTRKARFRAIELSDNVTENTLFKIQKKLNISSEDFVYEILPKEKEKIGLNFPVLKRNQNIVLANECSQIHIPSNSHSWVYLPSDYETAFHQILEEVFSS